MIQPAAIQMDNGGYAYYYPGASEELVKECLIYLAAKQNQGFFDQGEKPKSGVTFSLYQLRKELKDRGHERSYKQLILSLTILRRSLIEISVIDDEKRVITTAAPYLTLIKKVSRSDIADDPESKWSIEFHTLITSHISTLGYRQFDYLVFMSIPTQLARWIYKLLVDKYTFAG